MKEKQTKLAMELFEKASEYIPYHYKGSYPFMEVYQFLKTHTDYLAKEIIN